MKDVLKEEFGHPINKIFFIGIGGTSMSGLAKIAQKQGFEVEGSDMRSSGYTDQLIERGIPIHIGHNKNNVPEDTDLVVFSAAIHEDNPEMIRAQELDISRIERSDYLGLLSRVFNTTIGVAGTHGKTTTSSMIAQLLFNAEKDPSATIGGSLDEIGGNAHLGKNKDYFIVESCEYVDSFLKTQHEIGVITNIEEDHLDYFTGGLPQIVQSFHRFGMILPKNGLMVAWGDSDVVRNACLGLKCPVIFYGFDHNNDWIVKNVRYDHLGKPSFDAYKGNQLFGHFNLEIPGKHNVLNAMATIIVGNHLGIDKETIRNSLQNFHGAHRRFEFRGKVNSINVYEDYAHHPTELRVTIESALNHDHNNLWVVFQPHTYSRTKDLFDQFVEAFEKADKIILNDIYSDREGNEKYDIFSEDLAKRIKQKYHIPTIVMTEFDSIVKFLIDNLVPEDLVLVAGSQTINKVASLLVEALQNKYGGQIEEEDK